MSVAQVVAAIADGSLSPHELVYAIIVKLGYDDHVELMPAREVQRPEIYEVGLTREVAERRAAELNAERAATRAAGEEIP